MDWVDGTCRACAREGRVTPLGWALKHHCYLCDDHVRQVLLVMRLRMKLKMESAEIANDTVEGNEKTETLPAELL